MANYNRVILVGNLTKDPEIRYIPSGTAVGDFSMAINRKYKGSDGSMQEETCFVDITVWGRQAETCGEYLHKGSSVLVEGRLKLDRWEKDGQKHSRLSVVADRTQFLGGSGNSTPSNSNTSFSDGAPASPVQAAPAAQPAPAQPVQEKAEAATADDENLPF